MQIHRSVLQYYTMKKPALKRNVCIKSESKAWKLWGVSFQSNHKHVSAWGCFFLQDSAVNASVAMTTRGQTLHQMLNDIHSLCWLCSVNSSPTICNVTNTARQKALIKNENLKKKHWPVHCRPSHASWLLTCPSMSGNLPCSCTNKQNHRNCSPGNFSTWTTCYGDS